MINIQARQQSAFNLNNAKYIFRRIKKCKWKK